MSPEPKPGLLTPVLDFLLAVQFLTVLPPLIGRDPTPQEMGRAVGYYPLVGLILGAILLGAQGLLGWLLPALPAAGLLLGVWIGLTGALHLDGFLDACDGLLGGSTPQRRLEIMRDHHIGAFAFAGGALLLLVKFAALAAPGEGRLQALLLAPILGRWSMSLAMVAFPYARSQGLGRHIKDHVTWRQALLATVISLAAAWGVAGWHGLAAAGLALGVTLGISRLALTRIPGLTGDVYGLLNELTELAVLLAFSIHQGGS